MAHVTMTSATRFDFTTAELVGANRQLHGVQLHVPACQPAARACGYRLQPGLNGCFGRPRAPARSRRGTPMGVAVFGHAAEVRHPPIGPSRGCFSGAANEALAPNRAAEADCALRSVARGGRRRACQATSSLKGLAGETILAFNAAITRCWRWPRVTSESDGLSAFYPAPRECQGAVTAQVRRATPDMVHVIGEHRRNPFAVVDVDPADGVHELLEAVEVDQHNVVDRDAG